MASLYWVGGTNTWNSTAGSKWATSSGGAGGAAAPTAADDVFIDANSTGTITLSTTTLARSINFTGFTGTVSHPTSTTIPIGDGTAGASNVALKLVAGMTYTLTNTVSSILSFVSTSATQQTIDFGGKTTGGLTFNGVGGSWQFISSHNQSAANAITTLTNGTLDLNGQTCNWGIFTLGAGTKTLTCGASSITCNGASGWAASVNTANTTINAGTSTINIVTTGANFDGGGFTYSTVALVPTAATTPQTVTGTNTFANLTFTGGAAKTYQFQLSNNQTITGTLTVNGNSSINRVLLASDTPGTARTLTAAAVSMSNVDLQDITGAGAASWNLSAITGLSGDCGGCSGITFTTATTQTATGTASFNWSSHGWTTHVPLPQDTVSIPNAFIAGRTVTIDMPRVGKDISFTCTGNPLLTSNVAWTAYGSLTFASGMTTSGGNVMTFGGRSTTHTVTTNGVSFSWGITTNCLGWYTLQDALTTTAAFTLTSGVLNTNGNNVTSLTFVSGGALSRSLTMGSGGATWTLTQTTATTIWNVSGSNYTIASYAEGIIQIANASANARTFAGGGSGGGSGAVYGSLTYTVAGSTGSLTITGSNTFDTINFSDSSNARSLLFTAGTTQIVRIWNVSGTPGKLVTIDSPTAATHTLSKSSGTVSADYLSVKNSVATGGATWYAGANSTSVSGNTGWTFSAAPTNISRGQVAGSGHGVTGGFGAQSVTLPGAVTAGQLLVCLWVGNSNVGPATCADNINGAWTALTEQTPVAGSGRRMNWFYKLASAAASAGGLTVTVTPNANAGNSEWMQVATYNGVGSFDSSVNAYSTWTGGAGTISQLSGIPSQSGDLILYGIMSDAENTQTMTAVSPMTSMVLDGSSQSGGVAAPFAIAFDELIGAVSSTVTAAMSLSNGGDDGGRWVIGFRASAIATKTQTAVGRIANTKTKTQTVVGRIAAIVTKLQTATANIAGSAPITKTQSALARIAANSIKTQSAISRIATSINKTQAAVSRIATNSTKTQAALARIAKSLTAAQTAVSRIANGRTKTQTSVGRIARTVTFTQGAISRLAGTQIKTQGATANIQNGSATSKTQAAIARVAVNFIKTQPGLARIAMTRVKTQGAVAAIKATAAKTQASVSRISNSRPQTQAAVARISKAFTKAQTSTAAVKVVVRYTQSATANVIGSVFNSHTQTATARMATLVFKPPTYRISALYVDNGPDRVYPASKAANGLFKFFKGPQVGWTVLKHHDGTYEQVKMPTQDQCDAAARAYLGGHEYIVTGTEANALTAAGYTVEVQS